MTDVIKTNRLVLRRHEKSDAADIARLISDWDVIQWLTSPPWPYALADAEWFLDANMSKGTYAITQGTAYAGCIGIGEMEGEDHPDLGYWLGKPYWGQGLMTEAASAVVGYHFGNSGKALVTGYVQGNGRSDNVLTKLGFKNTCVAQRPSLPQQKDVPVQRMILTRPDWQARHG